MGSSFRSYVRDIPISERKPKGPRVALAPKLAYELIKFVQSSVISPQGRYGERECYEISLELRDKWSYLKSIVQDHIPGSALARSNVAQNRITLSQKIVMVVLDRINTELVRPGPKPEDRLASDTATELWEMQDIISDLIAQVIQVEDEYEGLLNGG